VNAKAAALVICMLLSTTPLAAQMRGEDAVVRPVRVERPPKIDGLLDEELWREIEPISDFRQQEPDNGELATERTEVRVCYDGRYLYFGVRAYDSEPDKIIARSFERDSWIDNDDTFSISIDSFDDNRTAYAFDTNVLGTQLDVQISDSGEFNKSWDAIWYSKGNIDEQGYTLEIAIPFFALRFKPAEEVKMGILLERLIRRKNEQVFWPGMTRDYKFESVSQYGTLAGLRGIERGVDLEVKPYGIAGYSEAQEDSDYHADAGIDLKWGVTPNLTADFTVNPDFAQVESDALQLNLTRFSLFYPEKREFFIESADLFQFGLDKTAEVFFSRRIGLRDGSEMPIIGGARAHGLLGDTNVGLMTMRTGESGDFGGESFSVARLKHNILGRSYVGGIITSRQGVEEREDTTLGGDFMFLTRNNFMVRGLIARSGGGAEEGNWMGSLGVSLNTDICDWIVRYDDIGANFNPGIGFIRRPDQKTLTINVHYNPRPGWKGVRQLTFGNLYRRTENHAGVVETRLIRPGFIAVFQSGDWLMTLYADTFEYVPYSFWIAPGVEVPAGEYKNRQGTFSFTSDPSRRFSLDTTFGGGNYYGGDILSASLRLTFKPLTRLHLSTEQYLDRVEIPGGGFESLISRLFISYFLSPSLTTRVGIQHSTLMDDFVFNFRLRWIYAPGSEAWLVYDEGHRFGLEDPSLRDRALIMKVVYNFNI